MARSGSLDFQSFWKVDMATRPRLVYADSKGRIYDCPTLEMSGRSGNEFKRLRTGEWIPLPPGSELFMLPQRLPIGYDASKKRFEVLRDDPCNPSKPVQAVAAFMAPAHTQIYSAAYQSLPGAPVLPLFAYTAVGWFEGQWVVAGTRVDRDERQDHRHFNHGEIKRRAIKKLKDNPDNRLIQHLGKCALSYGCPAAKNFFMNRWEAPLPTSPVCNARCLGCISLQEASPICATQDRISFVPKPEEIASAGIPHLLEAPRAVVSFGQGCEGEPLLQSKVIREAIRLMRESTTRGTINLNSNGSLPDRVKELLSVGLDSIRVSLNSCRPEYYHAYFRPRGYEFADVVRSLTTVKSEGGFASINYFILPGFSDQPEEIDALCHLISETKLDLIQMRNLNIDPEWYWQKLGITVRSRPVGILQFMKRLKDRFPDVRFGYFNPCLDRGV